MGLTARAWRTGEATYEEACGMSSSSSLFSREAQLNYRHEAPLLRYHPDRHLSERSGEDPHHNRRPLHVLLHTTFTLGGLTRGLCRVSIPGPGVQRC